MDKVIKMLVVLAGVFVLVSGCADTPSVEKKDKPACAAEKEKPACAAAKEKATCSGHKGWRLGMQAYSFRMFTFFEAIDKTASLGLKYIEAYPSQSLSKEQPDIQFSHDMPAQARELVKQKLKDTGVTLVCYGVVGLSNDEAECRRVFDFAKEMGIENIVTEPAFEAFDLLDKLCQEYSINIAIHNHPAPSLYWSPDTALKYCQGRSKWIGVCADTGHWPRSGIKPIDALKKLEGRVISFHLKDLNEFGNKEAHDVPWGTGIADMKAILTYLDEINFQGVFSIEYEHNWENSLPEIAQCVSYFNETGGQLQIK